MIKTPQMRLATTAQAPTLTSSREDRISRSGISTIFPTGTPDGVSVEFRLGIETGLKLAPRERLFIMLTLLLVSACACFVEALTTAICLCFFCHSRNNKESQFGHVRYLVTGFQSCQAAGVFLLHPCWPT